MGQKVTVAVSRLHGRFIVPFRSHQYYDLHLFTFIICQIFWFHFAVLESGNTWVLWNTRMGWGRCFSLADQVRIIQCSENTFHATLVTIKEGTSPPFIPLPISTDFWTTSVYSRPTTFALILSLYNNFIPSGSPET